MAYINQERKAKLAGTIKAILKNYGVKGSLGIRNHSTLVLNIKSGKIDFIKNYNETTAADLYYHRAGMKPNYENYINVNEYHFDKHFTGVALKFLTEIVDAMNDGNWDNSDIQTDYFDVGWYIDINIGRWDQPYVAAP